jgi:hypothetical protein
MNKGHPLSPLPPLSVKAFRDLTEIEEEVAEAIKDCDDFGRYHQNFPESQKN